MTFGLVFWILMLIWLLFGIWSWYTPAQPRWGVLGHNGFLFVLFLLLGWRVFGAPIHP